MSKQVNQKTKKVKAGPVKAPAGKILAASRKMSARVSGSKKTASPNSASSRTAPVPSTKVKTPARTASKSGKVTEKLSKTKTKAAKPAPKAVPKAAPKDTKAAHKPIVGRKPAPAKPSRAKSIADSKKAPAMARKAVQEKPAEKPAIKKSAGQAPKAPVKPVSQKDKPATPTPKKLAGSEMAAPSALPAVKPVLPPAAPYKAPSEFDGFKVNDHVVYPTHGVGKIVAVEAQEIAGTRLELFVISFEQEKMTLRVPLGKAKAVGMRILSSRDTVRAALKTLQGRARIKRTMWSRRAQEYEAKINSGDLLLIAEVVRDLHRAEGQPEQSYSERQIYESALERMAREVGAIEELDNSAAMERVGIALKKAA